MVIQIISSNTIKITLDGHDMDCYNVSFEKLDRANPETKHLLLDLIQYIQDEKKIDLSSERLFVEAFPKDDGGCLLYISVLSNSMKSTPDKNSLYNSIICKMTSPQELIEISHQIYNNFNHILHNSELYFSDNTYILRITSYNVCYTKLLRIIGRIIHENSFRIRIFPNRLLNFFKTHSKRNTKLFINVRININRDRNNFV